MVNYCTLAQVKLALKIDTGDTENDELLNEFIEESSLQIDNETARQFYASYETRRFDAAYPTIDANMLFVDKDLLGITTLTNGNGTAIAPSAYVFEPANYTPYYAVTLLTGATSLTWQYNNDWQQAISVEGTWGYNLGTTPPIPIRRACIRRATWRFKQRDAPFETSSFPEIGAVVTPTAIPEDVITLLAPFKRIVTTAIYDKNRSWW